MVELIENDQIEQVAAKPTESIAAILLVVKDHTRGFLETNVNVMKALLSLFLAVCRFHESKKCALIRWVANDTVAACVQKISDRKLSEQCKDVLSNLCVVTLPSDVLDSAIKTLKVARSPVVHEEFLKWLCTFYSDFGASTAGSSFDSVAGAIVEVRFVIDFTFLVT